MGIFGSLHEITEERPHLDIQRMEFGTPEHDLMLE